MERAAESWWRPTRDELAQWAGIGLRIDEQVLYLDGALQQLEADEPRSAQLTKLHFFTGLTLDEEADSLGISTRMAERDWAYARATMGRVLKACEF